MADKGKPSKLERIKESSRFLRGTIAEQLAEPAPNLVGDDLHLIKFHGSYQQDDRDRRGGGSKEYMLMVRSRVPGGRVSAGQFLAELDLCEKYGNGTLRITDRQAFQLHGILKGNLRDTIRGINEAKLSTLSACGDVCRNFMCCPAPINGSPVRRQMQEMAATLAGHFRPRSSAYYEIWLKDGDESQKVHEVTGEAATEGEDATEDVEPIYGHTYLPRKFKFGIALPEDNCVDIYTQDLGLMAVVEGGRIVGYNVLVGGGQGMTPVKKETFPAVGQRLTFVAPEQTVALCEAIVKVQRDHGNRSDRKFARMKYLIANWGLGRFKATVEEYYGHSLPEPHPCDITDVDDHMGWHEQGDGKRFLGINVENGRIQDDGDVRIKSAIRAILARYPVETRLTALQGMILCDLDPSAKDEINAILTDHGVPLAEDLTPARRYSIACPAFPTCGLAITESERIMPQVMDSIEAEMQRHGLGDERITVHMTGCPNGCARPYTPDIGLVGKARGKYTLYLGGNPQGTRIGFIFAEMVPQEEIASRLSPLLAKYNSGRTDGESFGDYCHRAGKEALSSVVATE